MINSRNSYRKALLFVLIIISFVPAIAQTPNWLWAKNPSCTGSFEDVRGVKVGSNGDIFAAGRYGNTMSYPPAPTISALGGTPIYVTRVNNSGTPVWVSSVYSTGGMDYAYGMNIDNNDNTYVAICSNSGSGGSAVVKVSPTGAVLWTATGTGAGSGAYGVAASPVNGDVYMCGDFSNGTQNFTSSASATSISIASLSASSGNDVYLAKYNSAGAVQWVRVIGGQGLDLARSMVCDAAGNVYISGSYENTATLGTITLPAAPTGGANLYIAKYNNAGVVQWVAVAPGAGIPSSAGFTFWRFNAIDIDACGDIYVTGEYRGTASFGTTSFTSAGGADAYVAKVSSAGVWQWAFSGGGATADDMGLGIAVDDEYSVYVGGYLRGTTSWLGNTVTGASTTFNLFVAKFSNSPCNAVCPQPVNLEYMTVGSGSGSVGYEAICGLDVDNNKRVYGGGGFGGTVSFGSTSLTSGGGGDMLLAALDSVPRKKIVPTLDLIYCAGGTFVIPYNSKGVFGSTNIFTVQLSDSSGNFNTPVNIGTVSSTTSGNISVSIPATTIPGNNYKIRIVSSNPYYIGTHLCLNIKILPAISVNPTADMKICNGVAVPATTFSGNPAGGVTYSWTSAGASIGIPANGAGSIPAFAAVNTGSTVISNTIIVTPEYTGPSGCPVVSDTFVITIFPQPLVSFNADVLSGCAPLCVNFTNQSNSFSAATNYKWNFGDGSLGSSLANPSHCFQSSGGFNIKLNLITAEGCKDSLVLGNMINVYPNPTAHFITPQQFTTLEDANNYSFVDQSQGSPTTWLWDFGDTHVADASNNISVTQNAAHVYSKPGNYCVNLKVTTEHGCTDSTENCFEILPEYSLYIPNSFTPNGDGINDLFSIKGDEINTYELRIYDRWGNLIFKSNDLNTMWDGKKMGGSEIVQQDVYVYVINVAGNDYNKYYYTGHINLLR